MKESTLTNTAIDTSSRCDAPHKDTEDCAVLAVYRLVTPCGCVVNGCDRTLALWETLDASPWPVHCSICNAKHSKADWLMGRTVEAL